MKPREPILVVDDDESYRAILRYHLEALGYQVLEAEDGGQGFRIASQRPLQLIILDIVMPDTEGLETISRLRSAGVGTKILAVSGMDRAREYLELAVMMGADAKVEKIGPISELLKVVRLVVEDANPVTGSP